jgi:hypothetical protein
MTISDLPSAFTSGSDVAVPPQEASKARLRGRKSFIRKISKWGDQFLIEILW